MNTIVRLAAVFVVISMLSCKESATDPPVSQSVILPLAVGNMWIADMTLYLPDSSILVQALDTTQIPRDTTMAGEKWYRSDERSWLRNKADGAYEWIDPEASGTVPLLLLKYPATVGETYQGSPAPGVTVTMTVVSTNEQVIIEGKSYTCYHYLQVSSFSASENHFYLEPDKGWVKMEVKTMGGNGKMYTVSLWELKERVLK